jgi:hypothetical protein
VKVGPAFFIGDYGMLAGKCHKENFVYSIQIVFHCQGKFSAQTEVFIKTFNAPGETCGKGIGGAPKPAREQMTARGSGGFGWIDADFFEEGK